MGELTQHGRRAALTLLGFLLASLVLPAATKQWSDRSGELALKKELVSQINATVNSLQLLKSQSFESSLRGALIDSLRR